MFDGILQKGRIGNVELNNCMVMPAMGSSHGEADGKVGDEIIEYYAARARGGFGLIITEFVCIEQEGKAMPGQPMIDTDDYIPGFNLMRQEAPTS